MILCLAKLNPYRVIPNLVLAFPIYEHFVHYPGVVEKQVEQNAELTTEEEETQDGGSGR